MNQPETIYVAGHRGMVGSAIVRQLIASGHPASAIVTCTHAELDLTNQAAVRAFFARAKPHQVYLAAAKAGGIHANNVYPADFIYQNLMIAANVIEAAFCNGVQSCCSSAPASKYLAEKHGYEVAISLESRPTPHLRTTHK